MKNLKLKEKFFLVTMFMLCMMLSSYAQSSESAVTTTIGYFYSASGQMIDAEDNNGTMSSYLTRGERYNGISETFAVSNIKDITADLDSNGNVLNKYTYTAYGTQTSYSSTSNIQDQTLSINENPFTYSDYYTDSESGNYYLIARYYDPTLGIFLTSDSYNLPNRYMYVNGNPVMGVDPTGHISQFGFNNEWFHFGLFKHRDGTWHGHAGAGRWEEPNEPQHSIVQQEQNEPQQNIVQQQNFQENVSVQEVEEEKNQNSIVQQGNKQQNNFQKRNIIKVKTLKDSKFEFKENSIDRLVNDLKTASLKLHVNENDELTNYLKFNDKFIPRTSIYTKNYTFSEIIETNDYKTKLTDLIKDNLQLNGLFENYKELKKSYNEKGLKYICPNIHAIFSPLTV